MRITSTETLLAGLEAGVNLLDTADVYGDSERLVADALAALEQQRAAGTSNIVVATKGGLVVEETGWRRDGRAKHLVQACEASLRALRRDAIDLYQLHAPDPQVPIDTSVRALEGLARRGLIRRIGLSNVGVNELKRARDIAEIASLQVELGPLSDAAIKSGVAAEALRNGLLLLAYSPFGGPKKCGRIGRDEVLRRVAHRHAASAYEIALSYLRDLHPLIVPLPGPSTREHVLSCARHIALTDEDRVQLDARFPRLATLRPDHLHKAAERAPTADNSEEPPIVVIMGSPAAGKSTLVAAYEARGYTRLNRDLLGGKLDRLAALIDQQLSGGMTQPRFVLDNTYGTRSSRFALLEVAARHALRVRCLWLQTSLEDAQVNACQRMLARYGHILSPEEIAVRSKKDPNSFGPNALFRYQRSFEAPELSEGFHEVQPVAFTRQPSHPSAGEAVLLDLDSCASVLLPGSSAAAALRDVGAPIWAIAWRPGATEAVTQALAERAALALQAPVWLRVCPHLAGAPVCWCRKPLPGLPLTLMAEHRIAAQDVRYVGNSALDASFARRLGMKYVPVEDLSSR